MNENNKHPRGSECDEGYGCECDLNKARAINNKVAMDMFHNKTPRTDKAEPQIRFIKSGWVRSDFARELELELNALKKKLDDSKFGAQCSVHELEYDRTTLIKENLELKEEIVKLVSQKMLMQAELNEARNISDNFAYSIKNLGHYADKAISDYNSSLRRITDGIPANNIFTAYKKLLDVSS